MASRAKCSQAVFLDRDGVITRLLTERGPRETARTADDVDLLPKVADALQLLKEHGYALIVVTNQPNVAKGKSTWDDMKAIDQRFQELVAPKAAIDAIYSCYHHPDPAQVVVPELLEVCDCRKPMPGLILQAAQKYGIDIPSAWIIGDALTDLQAGAAAGIPPQHRILVSRNNQEPIQKGEQMFSDLWLAAQYIVTS